MNELRKKQQRVEPLIRIRQKQLDKEGDVLSLIRAEKKMTLDRLREQQNKYIQGVEQINDARQKGDGANLATLELGLDHVKNLWYEALRDLRIVEQKERAQLEQLYLAQRNIKSMESLKDRYDTQYYEYINKEEQKKLDEYAIQRFVATKK